MPVYYQRERPQALPRATMAPPLARQAGPQDITPERERLASAILNATGGGEPQPVESPWQAIGNASQQMAAAFLQKKQDERAKRGKQMPSMWGGGTFRQAPNRLRPIPRVNPRSVSPLKPPGG